MSKILPSEEQYWDIWIDTFHFDLIARQSNRIKASNKEQAIMQAFLFNVRNLSEEQASIAVSEKMQESCDYITIDDDDFMYRLHTAIQVTPMTVNNNGSDITVFVPCNTEDLQCYNKLYSFTTADQATA